MIPAQQPGPKRVLYLSRLHFSIVKVDRGCKQHRPAALLGRLVESQICGLPCSAAYRNHLWPRHKLLSTSSMMQQAVSGAS